MLKGGIVDRCVLSTVDDGYFTGKERKESSVVRRGGEDGDTYTQSAPTLVSRRVAGGNSPAFQTFH